MNYSRTAVKKTWGIFSIILAIFALCAANYSKTLEDLVELIKPADIKATYTAIFNISVKIFLALIFIIILCGQYILFLFLYEWKTLSLKRHKISSITSEILSTKNLKSITVFGYSISFAEELRFEIENGEKTDLQITLIVPSQDFIHDKLIDDQTKASRTEELTARLAQWDKLKTRDIIKTITIKRTESVPVENGFLVNESVIYIDYYKWEKMDDHYTLKKKPKNERDFLRIKAENKDLFNYIKYQLDTK